MSLDRHAAERRRFARLLGTDGDHGTGLPIAGADSDADTDSDTDGADDDRGDAADEDDRVVDDRDVDRSIPADS